MPRDLPGTIYIGEGWHPLPSKSDVHLNCSVTFHSLCMLWDLIAQIVQ